jgi:dienelactone hydrolase
MTKTIYFISILIGCLSLSGADLFQIDTDKVLPLDIKIIEKKSRDNVSFQRFFFTSQRQNGKTFRIYAVSAIPAVPGKYPMILHLHGGGQTASPQLVKRWAKRGYACISFDWTANPGGKHDNKRPFSKFGKQTEAKTIDYQFPEKTEQSRVRYALIAARRALAWARKQDNIDSARIGVIGLSWGGFYSLLLAGMEPEIKAVVDIYGCGYFSDAYGLTGPLVYRSVKARKAWLATYDPGSVVARIKAPTLMISGTNDMFFPLRQFVRTYQALKVAKRLILAPGVNHTLSWTEIDKTALVWLDHYLKGKKAKLPEIVGLEERSGKLKLRCKTNGFKLNDAKLFFTWSAHLEKWNSKNKWESKDVDRYKNSFSVKLPDYAPQGTPWLGYFISCITDSGVQVASPIFSRKVKKVIKTIPEQDFAVVNLFADPSLEKQKGKGFNGKIYLNHIGKFERDNSGAYARSGKVAVRLDRKNSFIMQSPTLIPGTEYVLSAWFKNAGDSGKVQLQVNWMNGKKFIKHYSTSKKVSSGHYDRVVLKSVAPKSATHCFLYFRADDAWIDDLLFGAKKKNI